MGDTRSTSTSCDICYAAVCGSEQDEGTLHDADAQRLVQHLGRGKERRDTCVHRPRNDD